MSKTASYLLVLFYPPQEQTKKPEAKKEETAPVAKPRLCPYVKPRANPPAKMTVKEDEGHAVGGPDELVPDSAVGEKILFRML